MPARRPRPSGLLRNAAPCCAPMRRRRSILLSMRRCRISSPARNRQSAICGTKPRMGRLDAMQVFIAALAEGGRAGAGRVLGRPPAAVSRAIAFLESHVGTALLHRTTRTIKLSEAGEAYAEACRRVLAELHDADMAAAGEHGAPIGTLTITAPPIGGEEVLRPVIDAFLEAFPSVSVNLVLLNRAANLVEEGIDVALRILALPDSSLVAIR